MVAPSNNAAGTPRATQALAKTLIHCGRASCTGCIALGVAVHKTHVLKTPPTCRVCKTKGITRRFVFPPGTNQDPGYYRWPYANGTNNTPQGGPPNKEIISLKKEMASLKAQLRKEKPDQNEGATSGNQPEEAQPSIEQLQEAIIKYGELGVSTAELEAKLATTKASAVKALKPPTLVQVHQKYKASENHAKQCVANMAKQQELLEASEIKACKAEADADALKLQYEALLAQEGVVVKSATFTVPEGLNTSQQDQYNLALQTFRAAQAESIKKQEADFIKNLGNMEALFKQANLAAKAEDEQNKREPMEQDTQGPPQEPLPSQASGSAPQPVPNPPATVIIITPPLDPTLNKENTPPAGILPSEEARQSVRRKAEGLRAGASQPPSPNRDGRSRSPPRDPEATEE